MSCIVMAMPPGIIEELDLLLPMLTNEISLMGELDPFLRLDAAMGWQIPKRAMGQ